jgi:polyisoprenyl-teichoic acid--peptidoglycan teichoic acid transferase
MLVDRMRNISIIRPMKEFKVRKIEQKRSRSKYKAWRKLTHLFGHKGAIGIMAVIGLGIIFWGGSAVIDSGFFVEKTRQIFSFGPLDKDKNGHTNILLLGVAGDGAEGGNLSDSIMVVSVNPSTPSVSMLSLPRDLFLPSRIGDRKVNEIYAAARYKQGNRRGLEIIKDAVSEFTGMPIHYGAVVNFKVFAEVIDEMGGLDIFVPEAIEDPFYPDVDYGYQTFVVRKGFQHFDGDTALKYARSRKTSSDYDRAKRQQDIILAIRQKAENMSLLTDFGKLGDFFQLYRKNVNTDMGLTQTVALAKVGLGIDYGNVVSAVLNDDPAQMGGLLYTPAKEFYGGQFVLLPEDLKDTQLFMDLVLIHPEILLENAQVSVLNGSMTSGLASRMAVRLRRLGFHVIDIGNHKSDRPVFRTFLKDFTGGKDLRTKKILEKVFDVNHTEVIPVEEQDPNNLIDLQVILGTN